ncbi:FAD-binding oxidoreductase [Kitasatospora sp. RG8]|uniref:FAD-dependent oxidoreductase n=1 Tax=Kitasatospora sp. RG8 TaxID=2820815 RepID=UPI001ADFFA13|nr:FAD-dependent oxidoreductase [Kitasatospora sp. RG8]MBP0454220.1 FAD-binding oxidoreductase [Kitasatospora sp. RG8]
MKVRVVGAGIVGLTCALRLREAGHEVALVAADRPENTTSSVAAALWYPYRALPEQAVTRWAAHTYDVLKGMLDSPDTGVRLRTGRELFRRPTKDPWWAGAVPTLERVPPAGLPTGYADGLAFPAPVVDMKAHLAWLLNRLHALDVDITWGMIRHLDHARADVDAVVNCTGLGARELVHDRTLTPVRGQVVIVEQTGLDEWTLDQSDPRRLTYIVPRTDTIVLGGTAEERDEDDAVRPTTASAIVQRCSALVPQVAGARILGHRVGLRPARPAVRLEAEEHGDRGLVVHCYGHGGAGVTLSYGCAADVVRLVSEHASNGR